MTWFKVDDTLATHPKARVAGLAAMGLWTVAGAFASQHLTDGFVPEWYVKTWPQGMRLAQQLVTADLWRVADGGWLYHQWDERQPTKAKVEEERSKTRARQQAWRDSHRDKGSFVSVSNGVTDDVTNAAPSRPDPSRPKEKDFSSELRPDVESVCEHLAKRIEDNGSKRPTITKQWRDSARLMIDKDKRSEGQVHRMIDWCQADEFWRANILSMPKLREKYDQMRLKASEQAPSTRPKVDALGFVIE